MTDPNPFAPLLDSVVAIATRAGDSILYHYAKASDRTLKNDGSPVTEADRASEAVILFGLGAIAPDLPILSEEQVAEGHIPDLSAGIYWCVDPLDGTKEYLGRTGEFTVCIGGVIGSYPAFGVLHAPVLGVTVGAVAGGPAFRFDADGTRAAISVRSSPATGKTALISRSHRDGTESDRFLKAENATDRRVMGSAVKFGLIAMGEADVYARFGPTSEWDSCAGQAVLEAAGGSVRDLKGERLRCGQPKFLNPGFIARGAL